MKIPSLPFFMFFVVDNAYMDTELLFEGSLKVLMKKYLNQYFVDEN